MAAFRPHNFGRYTIVDPIAVGGMAEIYRARLGGGSSKDSPDRIIIIKKVIANLSQNTEFIQMFEEEIKITVGLTHPNIIQIYDYGKVDDQYFMAMEYVEGKNLRQFVKRLAEMKSMFSIDMSSHIISQICHALGYAHSFKDRLTGKPLGIVHRDISPQNIMISYDGAVKLFDFGIAKAKSASEATRAGVIKGKPSYLSPEQVNAEVLDGRSDIFALGIVLWELLTAKRLFVADTDMGVLRLIQSAKIEPPSTFNPAVPQALDAIILKSLARDKEKRYQNAEEFQRDLHKFLYSFNPSFNPADLSYYAQELFKGEIRDDRERLHKALAIEPIADPGVNGIPESTKSKVHSTVLAEGLVSSVDFNRDAMEKIIKENTGNIDLTRDSEGDSLELATRTKLGAKIKTSSALNQARTKGASSARVAPLPGAKSADGMVLPPWSKMAGAQAAAGRSNGAGSRSGSRTASIRREASLEEDHSGRKAMFALLLLLFAGVFGARQMGILKGTPLEFLDASDSGRNIASPNSPLEEAPISGSAAIPNAQTPASGSAPPVSAAQATILLASNVDGYSVSVNGVPTRVISNQFSVPLHTALSIQISKAGYETTGFSVTASDAKAMSYTVNLKQVPMGVLNFTTTPNAKLTFTAANGQVMHMVTPLRNQQLPAGKYHVLLENDLIGYKGETEVVIEQNKVTQYEKSLQK